MPRTIKTPDGVTHSFPDDATDAEISAALNPTSSSTPAPAKAARTWTDTAVDALPAVGGAVGGILGGTAGTAFGMGLGGVPGVMGGAALGAAAGDAYKQLIQRARGKATPETRPQIAGEIGTSAVTQGVVPEVLGAGVGAVMSRAAGSLMHSAAKPGLKVLAEDVKRGDIETPRVVKTLLNEGINVTSGGIKKLQTLLTSTQANIKGAIASAGSSGAEISPYRVASRLGETAKTFSNQVTPAADLETIGKVGNEFLKEHGGTMLAPETAQAMKTGTYAQLRKKYGQLSTADDEAQKALARGLKEELEQHVPGIGALNQQEAKLLEALNVAGRRVALSGNRDPIGFAWVTHNPMVFLTALIDRSPAVKSMLARGLYQSAGAAAKVSPQLIRTAVTALASQQESQ